MNLERMFKSSVEKFEEDRSQHELDVIDHEEIKEQIMRMKQERR